MSRPELLTFTIATTDDAGGAAVVADRFTDKRVQVSGTWTGSLKLQGAITGGVWVDIGTAITSSGIIDVSGLWRFMRVYRTSVATGAPVIEMLALDQRVLG